MLVVLYHCNAIVPGGYVGVDVFFVISGFLITSQLARELLATGTISLRGFYARRARRILPAATVTTLVTVVVSGILLSPLAATRVFSDARAATVFGANIHFAARDANYFNADLPPSPLQHYWSLSVEEQFYLVCPLLLIVTALVWRRLRRRRRQALRPSAVGSRPSARARAATPRLSVALILAIVAALSLAWSIVDTPQSPAGAYYSIFTRAWELAAGALVALSLPVAIRLDKRLAAVITWIGVACIVVAATSFGDSTLYPGFAALLPVVGAVAIIAAGSAANRRGAEVLLGTAPCQRVGSWSYSWYLWHWPVLILAPALLGHSLSTLEALTMAVLALLFAVMSFVLIERPIRRMQKIVRRPVLGLGCAALTIAATLSLVGLSGPVFASLHLGRAAAAPAVGPGGQLTEAQLASDLLAAVSTQAVPSNLDPPLAGAFQDLPVIAANGCLLVASATRSTGCIYGDATSHTSVVLFGDSHAAMWFPALNTISQQQHWRLVILTKSGCPAAAVNLVRRGRLFTACPAWRRNAEQQIAALHPSLVIVASSQYIKSALPLDGVPTGYGSTWQDGTEATFKFLRRSADHVVFIANAPGLQQPAPDCVSAHVSDVQLCTISRRAAVARPKVKAEELQLAASNHIHAIDPMSWFCTPTRCPVIVGNILLYRDAQHITPQWAQFLTPLLSDAITPVMNAGS